MLYVSNGKDSALESIVARRAVFFKCSIGDLALKLPIVDSIGKNVVYVDPITGELSQFGGSLPGPTTGSYTPIVLSSTGLMASVDMETAIFTKINDIVTVYGTLLANYVGDGDATGELQITVPLPFNADAYLLSTVGSATFTGGRIGPPANNPGLFLQKHRMVFNGDYTIVFELATMTENPVSLQIGVPFSYSFTYLTTA